MMRKLETQNQANKNERPQKKAGALQSPLMSRSACPFVRRKGFGRRGQQIIEYAVMVSAISAALVAIYVYSQRGLQAVIKASVDQIGPQSDSATTEGIDKTEGRSISDTVTSGTTNISASGGQRIYTFDSTSEATGNAVSTTTKF